MRRHAGLAVALAGAFLVAACVPARESVAPAAGTASAPTGVTPGSFALPAGSGCAGEIARFQAVIDNDLATGHTTRGVHERVSAEIAGARATCAAGNERGALAAVQATKSRFGYR
jgi:hypothetical protein